MKKKLITLIIMLSLLLSTHVVGANNLDDGLGELADKIVKKSMSNGKKTIGIVSFELTNGKQSALSQYIAEELVLQLFNVPNSNLQIVERSQLNKLIKEVEFSQSGILNPSTVKAFKVHGIDALLIGSITNFEVKIKINARLIDTETGRVYSAASTTVLKTESILEFLNED